MRWVSPSVWVSVSGKSRYGAGFPLLVVVIWLCKYTPRMRIDPHIPQLVLEIFLSDF